MRFTETLNIASTEFKRPRNIPNGIWQLQITKYPSMTERTDKDGEETTIVEFLLRLVAPTEEVDADEVAAYGDYSRITVRKSFWVPNKDVDPVGFERSTTALKRFLIDAGVEEGDDITMGEMLESSPNAMILGEIVSKPDKDDPEVLYDNLGKTMPM